MPVTLTPAESSFLWHRLCENCIIDFIITYVGSEFRHASKNIDQGLKSMLPIEKKHCFSKEKKVVELGAFEGTVP